MGEFCVGNVHLEAKGGDRNEKQRNSQLASVLKRVSGNTVVCGDFNSNLNPGSQLHTQLASANLVRAPTKGITLSQTSGYADILDHIWASEHMTVCRVLGSSSKELAVIKAMGMPSEAYPSDHLPVAAMFDITRSLSCPSIVEIPLAPSEEVREEWLQICSCAEIGCGKQAAREQKRLEAAFLQTLTEQEATNLCNWRAAADKAAKHILSVAVERAIVSLECKHEA